MKLDRHAFDRDGYLILRDVFDASEIEQFRAAMETPGQPPGDLLCKRGLEHIVWDERLLEIFGDLVNEKPIYFGFSSANVATEMAPGTWHRDNADRLRFDAPDWTSPYSLIRFGIYLEDHKRYSGGLNLRPGSHLAKSAHTKRVAYADTSPGDLVVWNMRIEHSGFGYRLKFPAALAISPELGGRLPSMAVRDALPRRRAIFISYGADDAHLKRYIQYLKTRTFMVTLWSKTHVEDEVVVQMNERTDLSYFDMPGDVQANLPSETNVGHVDLVDDVTATARNLGESS
jgi:hypothetical protein